jgi:ribonucleoside-diphosphate reductase alpha chain
VPLAGLLQPALGLCFVPAGRTDDADIPSARWVADYLARRLALGWLPYAERAALGVFTAPELQADGAVHPLAGFTGRGFPSASVA